jgi:hypothetical protein
MLLLLWGGLSAFQALVWALPSFPKTRATLLTLLVLALLLLAAIPFDSPSNRPGEPVLMGGLAVLWLGGVGGSWLGVTLERRGFWSGWFGGRSGPVSFRLVLPRTVQFAGPLHAQSWMEWRRNGRVAVAVTLVLYGLLLVCTVAAPLQPGRGASVLNALVPVLSLATAAWAGIAGLNLARDGSWRKLALSSFTAVRPVKAGLLVEAKLLVGAMIWLANAAGLTLVWGAAIAHPDRLPAGWLFGWILSLAVLAHLFIGILPVSLTGRIGGFPWSLLPWLLVYGAVANVVIWFGEHRRHLDVLFWLCVVALAIKLGAAAWGFLWGIRRRCVSSGFAGVYAGFWLLGSFLMVGVVSQEIERVGAGEWGSVLIPAAGLLIPLARVAVSPLALSVNRHR